MDIIVVEGIHDVDKVLKAKAKLIYISSVHAIPEKIIMN